MKRLLVILLALLLAAPVSAQSPQIKRLLLQQRPAPVVGGGSPTFTNFDAKSSITCGFQTTCTISGLTVAAGFNVAAGIVNNSNTGISTISGITLCGTTLTPKATTSSANSTGTAVALFYGTVAGGTCTAVVTSSLASSISRSAVAVGLLSNLSSTTPGTGCTGADQPDGDSNYPCSSGITVPAGGFGVAAIGYDNITTMTSANLTIPAAGQVNDTSVSVAIAYTTTSNTPSFTGQGFVDGAIVAAPWN